MESLAKMMLKAEINKQLGYAYSHIYATSKAGIDALTTLCGLSKEEAEKEILEINEKAKSMVMEAASIYETKEKET